MVVDSGTREAIRNSVIFAVDMANAPVGAALREAFPYVIAFLEQNPKMGPVTAPESRHDHDDKHGVKLEDHSLRRRLASGPTEARAEAIELRNVVRRRTRAETGSVLGGGVRV